MKKLESAAREQEWPYGKAHAGASPQQAVTERATRPDGLSCSGPQGCVSFLDWPALLARDNRAKGDSLPKAGRRAMQSIGNTAAGIAAALTP